MNEENGPFQVILGSHDRKKISNDSKSANLESMQCQFNQETVEKILSDEPERLKNVLDKIRDAPDFEDIYQRRIGDLVATAYPKGSKAQN